MESSWDTMKLLMKQKRLTLFSGFVRIYLRAGEAGSIMNIDVSKQWSNVSYQNHPFGSYNLANLAMLDGFAKVTQYYQDAALYFKGRHQVGML